MWPHKYGTQFNHFSVILIGQFGIIFFNFLNSKKENYSFISPLKEQGMDAYYLGSPCCLTQRQNQTLWKVPILQHDKFAP
jgi:hypothetical protein